MRHLRRVSVGFTVFAFLVFATAIHAQQPINRNLAYMTPGAEISLRLKDEQVIAGVQLVSIDEKALAYKKDGMTVKIERDLVFRAKQADVFYSDLPLSVEDHARYADYVSYIRERGDVIVDVDHQTYVGTIVAETDSAMTIRTRAASYDVEKRKIAAWRKGGVWQGDAEARQEPSGSFFNLQPYLDKKRFFNFALMLTGPWAVLPQLGAGISSNVNWPVFVGVRASLGYIWVDVNTFGLLVQTSAYANVNLFSFGNARLFAGAGYLWRAGMIMDYAYGGSAQSYRGNRVYGEITQNTYTLHLGLKYKNLMFEAGAEMPISYKDSYVRPINNTTSDQLEIEKGVGRVKSAADTLAGISRVYANVSLMF
jgi:hypothetical protein